MNLDEKIKQDQKIAELKKKNQEEYRRVRAALQLACADPNVQIVLRHVAKLAGWYKSSVVINPATNDVATGSTIFNEGRRSLYLDLRRMLSDDARRIIESKGTEGEHGE